MTEQEAINRIKYRISTASESVGIGENCNAFEDLEMAIKALEEIQQYRATGFTPEELDSINFNANQLRLVKKIEEYREIGTVEEIKHKLAELERWHTTEVNQKIKNVFANTSTQICHNCDHKDEYIEELEAEIDKCREAVEKQKAKKPIIEHENTSDCVTEVEWKCPICGTNYIELAPCGEWCRYCGQKIDWSDK